MTNAFLTGCDHNTQWQLPWFLKNLHKHNRGAKVLIADFGMTFEMLEWLGNNYTIFKIHEGEGWFKKPAAMLEATKHADNIVWLDTDCEVRGNLAKMFSLTCDEMLSIVEDRPWSNRRPQLGAWYNTGVVAFRGKPKILVEWEQQCRVPRGIAGDQEILHHMMGGDEIKKAAYIKPLPHTYNTLRLDIVDNIAVQNPLVMHWTGAKGNEIIQRQINESS